MLELLIFWMACCGGDRCQISHCRHGGRLSENVAGAYQSLHQMWKRWSYWWRQYSTHSQPDPAEHKWVQPESQVQLQSAVAVPCEPQFGSPKLHCRIAKKQQWDQQEEARCGGSEGVGGMCF